jgi:hypothetical protein
MIGLRVQLRTVNLTSSIPAPAVRPTPGCAIDPEPVPSSNTPTPETPHVTPQQSTQTIKVTQPKANTQTRETTRSKQSPNRPG